MSFIPFAKSKNVNCEEITPKEIQDKNEYIVYKDGEYRFEKEMDLAKLLLMEGMKTIKPVEGLIKTYVIVVE